jgi:hypothetical protein
MNGEEGERIDGGWGKISRRSVCLSQEVVELLKSNCCSMHVS